MQWGKRTRSRGAGSPNSTPTEPGEFFSAAGSGSKGEQDGRGRRTDGRTSLWNTVAAARRENWGVFAPDSAVPALATHSLTQSAAVCPKCSPDC